MIISLILIFTFGIIMGIGLAGFILFFSILRVGSEFEDDDENLDIIQNQLDKIHEMNYSKDKINKGEISKDES